MHNAEQSSRSVYYIECRVHLSPATDNVAEYSQIRYGFAKVFIWKGVIKNHPGFLRYGLSWQVFVLFFNLSTDYLYRCTVHSVVYLINTPTNAHIFI
jgi:hypothetical protein